MLGIRYTEGVSALEQFLASFETTDPQLLLSDPFPSGFWPIPLLPKPTPKDQDRLVGLIKQEHREELGRRLPGCPLSARSTSATVTEVEAFDISKWLGKLRWIETNALTQLLNTMSSVGVLEHFILNGCGSPNMPVEGMVAHNTISRLTDRPLSENGLFFTKEFFISPQHPAVFHVLVACASYSKNDLRLLFENALAGGYGRDKSTGKGKIVVGTIRPFEIPKVDDPNAVLLLGRCAPTTDDPCEGYWQVLTRFGKLGGDWATGPGPTATTIHSSDHFPCLRLVPFY